ncbi:hypothetical protein B0H12DRAFT_1077674 [Mycena haematopus]|nr:hypothetical protein B0H12DRAFT_1077674 [Mycena haematopus]
MVVPVRKRLRFCAAGIFLHDHALRYDDPLEDCDSAFLARYYAVYKIGTAYTWLSPQYGRATGGAGTTGRTFPGWRSKWPGYMPIFLFFAGGEYYLYDMGTVTRFEERFTSHEDFLRRFETYSHSSVELHNVWHP